MEHEVCSVTSMKKLAAVLALVMLANPGLATQERQAARGAGAAARKVKSMVNGVAVDSDKTPLPNARVRLRNLQVNEVEKVATANQLGEFNFAIAPDVPYVVELADQSGNIVAVSDVLVANAGEVAGAVISLPSKLPALAGMFGETASSVLSAVAGTGLTVVDPDLPPLSPEK